MKCSQQYWDKHLSIYKNLWNRSKTELLFIITRPLPEVTGPLVYESTDGTSRVVVFLLLSPHPQALQQAERNSILPTHLGKLSEAPLA